MNNKRQWRPGKLIVLTVSTLLMTAGAPRAARAQAAGWRTEVVGKDAVLMPPGLAAGEFYQITIHPRVPMAGALITDFVDGFADRRAAALGKPFGTPKPAKATSHTVAAASRTLVAPSGAARAVIFVALAMDGENARVIEVAASANTLPRYQAQADAITREMIKQEKAAALASGRGLKAEKMPTPPQGMTPGGKVMLGIYAGNSTFGGKIENRFRLRLFASGEFQMCNGEDKQLEFGADTYRYDPITGKMEVGNLFALNNDRFDPNEAFCLYGRGADGKPYIHASENCGFVYRTTVLRYVGPPDRPSPRQQKAAKAAQEAEAARYKFVTPPGRGVPASQVAGIFHHLSVRPGMGFSTSDETYLLLQDGTVHDGLPVPPDELDVSLSRRREPEKWGHWRRQGATVLAAWPDQPNHFAPLRGEMAVPARPGERLSGRYGAGQTSGDFVTGGSYSVWGVMFTPEGRFLKDGYGGSSSGSLGATMSGFSADTMYDDEGSSTSVVSPGAVAGVSRKKPGGHRGGTYSVSGYALTLRYDDGRVARLPFFFESAKRDQICFEGATLALDDGK